MEILKHATNVYTSKVFKVFEDELCKAYDCALLNDEMGTINKSEVMERIGNIQLHLTQQIM